LTTMFRLICNKHTSRAMNCAKYQRLILEFMPIWTQSSEWSLMHIIGNFSLFISLKISQCFRSWLCTGCHYTDRFLSYHFLIYCYWQWLGSQLGHLEYQTSIVC